MQKQFIFFLNFCIHFVFIFSKCRFNWCKISQKWKLWRFEMSLIYYLLNIFSFISFQSKNFWNLSKCQLFIQSFSELILILICLWMISLLYRCTILPNRYICQPCMWICERVGNFTVSNILLPLYSNNTNQIEPFIQSWQLQDFWQLKEKKYILLLLYICYVGMGNKWLHFR